MYYDRIRKYPRTYKHNVAQNEQKVISLSGLAAAGIVAFAFVKGMFWGYMLKKRLD